MCTGENFFKLPFGIWDDGWESSLPLWKFGSKGNTPSLEAVFSVHSVSEFSVSKSSSLSSSLSPPRVTII